MEFEFIDGATAISRAAIYAGCNFFAGYPITPATSILIYMMKELPKYGGIAIQGEDEIASISMCISASLSGKKVLTATSGPGISLYSESIGLAITTEAPMVIVNVQRLGPATGGATTGAQGDILFMRWVTSGGLPMVILCPQDIKSMFTLTVQAFNIAESLRTPVFLATSKDMIMSMHTLNLSELKLPEVVERKYYKGQDRYIPYKIEKLSDIPEFLPYGSEFIVRHTTSMHDEEGYLTKDPQKIEKTYRHLEEKILKHMDMLEFVHEDLEEGAENLIIAYGVNSGAAKEAVSILRKDGIKTSLLIVESLFPVPEKRIKRALSGVKKVVIPEMNTGLYKEAIKHLIEKDQKLISIQRVDGELIDVSLIIEKGGFYE